MKNWRRDKIIASVVIGVYAGLFFGLAPSQVRIGFAVTLVAIVSMLLFAWAWAKFFSID